MDKMIDYIFGSLDRVDRNIGDLRRCLVTQDKINKSFYVSIMACVICIAISNSKIKEQQKKIDKLSKELDKNKDKKTK